MADSGVDIWRETITIPTYGVGEPDRNPMFLEKRVYQGSSGAVYPWPITDRIENQSHDRQWEAVFLENEYLKIMILPELGGRVQMALDKTNDYHFVYYNRVIKPALVGLAGPWISGGIEFNWPQHHRPNTFGPVDHEIVRNADGSCTLWCNEIDRMHGTRGMHGFTLHAGRAYFEVQAKLHNRTEQPQTFLWWANPAIAVDENHQSIFPPDVHAVMDHGKRDVSEFPIAKGTYYKVDYSPGTDISRYRNIPVPTSYMAYHSDYNFVGSYDHGRQAGLLHVCNHHISPGKKQWTWGHGDFGQAWDRHLTDDDGPYIELMCGVYTDNQPDFSWLMPGEYRTFSQYFMPYKGVGVVKNATLDAAVGLEVKDGKATVRVYTTAEQLQARVTLSRGSDTLWGQTFDGSPRQCFEETVALASEFASEEGESELCVTVLANDGRTLVAAWQDRPVDRDNIPSPATAIKKPEELPSTEALYLAGMHLEQYRHATREPMAYYREGLRREADDIRCNHALGKLLYRRGCFAESERHFRIAVKQLTRHNPNPCDGEPYYYLGLSLLRQERFEEAFDAFYKSTWNAAQQEVSFFQLARLASRRCEWSEALLLVDQCLSRNQEHAQAIHLKIALLAQLDRASDARHLAEQTLACDPFNAGALFELARQSSDYQTFEQRLRNDEHNYLELASDYACAGQYHRAVEVLHHFLDRVGNGPRTPMPHYYLGAYCYHLDRSDEAQTQFDLAAKHDPYLCFPNRLEEIAILQTAIDRNPDDAYAAYYLGNLWYDKRQHDLAIECWERASKIDPSFPTVWRNLCIGYFNARGDAEGAWTAIEKAFQLDPTDARVLFEFDQLAKRIGRSPSDRLARLEQHQEGVQQRDDLYLEYVALLNITGKHRQALEVLLARNFHPWEGGEGKVPEQFVLTLTQLARQALSEQRYQDAIDLLEQTEKWPHSLGEGKLAGIQENNIHYLLGLANRGLGNETVATEFFERAAHGLSEPSSAMFYNDQPPDMIFYQALALEALGQTDAAKLRFRKLLDYGKTHLGDLVEIDYFAVSLPDFLVFEEDLNHRNEIHCYYMMALGQLGLGDTAQAADLFGQLLALEQCHLGALAHGSLLAESLGSTA